MPFYEYQCHGDCKVSDGRFTLQRSITEPELKVCPTCKKPASKLFSYFSTPTKTAPLSYIDAKKAGFTVLKRINKGEYEKQ